MGRWGDFGDTGLEQRPEKPLRKSAGDSGDIDMERFFKNIEILERRARTMNKAQIYRLNQRLGEAVNQFHAAVTKYICRPTSKEPGRFFAGERVAIDQNGTRGKIVQFVDAGRVLVEFDQDCRKVAQGDLGKNRSIMKLGELRKIED